MMDCEKNIVDNILLIIKKIYMGTDHVMRKFEDRCSPWLTKIQSQSTVDREHERTRRRHQIRYFLEQARVDDHETYMNRERWARPLSCNGLVMVAMVMMQNLVSDVLHQI